MSFDINNSSYNSYITSNNSFSKDKISKLETNSNKTLAEIKTEATTTITKNGKTYYLVKVDGESYLYDYENDTYTKYSKSGDTTKETTYNAQSDSVSIADSKDKRRENFSFDATKDSENFGFLTATRDNNIFAKNVTVIDSFSSSVEGIIDGNNSVEFTHGEIVSAIIEAGGSKVNKINSPNLEFGDIASKLQSVLDDLNNGTDIDAINMSISAPTFPSLLDAEELTSENVGSLYEKLKEVQGAEDIISILDKIKELSDNGVSVTISAGNEADDTGSDLDNPDSLAYINGYDESIDSTKKGKDYNVFNLLTLTAGAGNKNVHIIGSSNNGATKDATATDSAAYSNYNDLVDKLYDGDINFNYVSDNGNGTYKFYVEGVGYCNLRLSQDELSKLKGKSFSVTGTSFAAPTSIAKNDTSLT